MLNISFLIMASTSFFWAFYCLKDFSFTSLSPNEAFELIHITFLPILTLWVIFAIIKNHIQNTTSSHRFIYFLEQNKKNIDTFNAINTNIQNYTTELKSNFIISQTDILISDINETLAEIVKRSNSISSSQMEHLLQRTSNGERWLIAKTFIETNNFQTGFTNHLLEKSQKDILLKGAMLEFYAKYKNLIHLLTTYDKYKILCNSVECGALGKVFDILAPVVAKISQTTPTKNTENKPVDIPSHNNEEKIDEIPSFLTSSSYSKAKQTTQKPIKPSIDEGLEAIRNELTKKAPSPKTNITNFSNTQTALRNLGTINKNSKIISIDELEKEINSSPENNYDTSISPLGDWLDEKKN